MKNSFIHKVPEKSLKKHARQLRKGNNKNVISATNVTKSVAVQQRLHVVSGECIPKKPQLLHHLEALA